MNWIEITVHTTTEGADIASQALIDAGSTGGSIEDKNDFDENQRAPGQWDLIDEQVLVNMPDDVLVHGYFGDDERIRDTVSQLEAHMRAVRDMDLPFDV
ncbi:MAG: 50S ribosomal protein L11 methyltransferase, partial [Candidatus Fimadaptatus sp.]